MTPDDEKLLKFLERRIEIELCHAGLNMDERHRYDAEGKKQILRIWTEAVNDYATRPAGFPYDFLRGRLEAATDAVYALALSYRWREDFDEAWNDEEETE